MASITIRDLPDKTKQKIRDQAVRSGRSMEAQARLILNWAADYDMTPFPVSVLSETVDPQTGRASSREGLGSKIRKVMSNVGVYLENEDILARDEFVREVDL
jgi:plasmid stability protein